jgi:uncharacterized protein (DUF1778 family)
MLRGRIPLVALIQTLSVAEYPNFRHAANALDVSQSSVMGAAVHAIGDHSRLTLSLNDSVTFVDALLNPKPVNDRVGDMVRHYRERVGF